ncbi:hypothetical protein [Porcipelethomonas sp.]|uniref:hypothetical protein n=1 Tax=Porcipelethomonas sp. TaxID=2981675 RepID=UPI003EF416D3
MSQTDVKIQNLVLPYDIDANLQNYHELTVKGRNASNMPLGYDPEKKCHIMGKYGFANFMTYFNCLQITRWKTYTNAQSFRLHLVVRGKLSVELYDIFRISSNFNLRLTKAEVHTVQEMSEITIDIPESRNPLFGFCITALENLEIYGGWYSALTEENAVHDVRISLVTTTFKKQDFIKNNIKILKECVLNNSELKDNIFVHIIDNERALDPDQLNCERLKVYPNSNTGGAGGFTRGMIEALSLEKEPTHILLMDDDVMIIAESIFRTFYLLRILKDEFSGRFLSGAMFDYDIRERQYEDIGYVHKKDASYGPLKPHLDMRLLSNIITNEFVSQENLENAYAGWWYCCIPSKKIKENGLPLPVFVRGDDVEFSLRNKAEFLTLNGICIWHVGFAGKFNAAMELYQVHRNSFIIAAASGICTDISFIDRIRTLFWHNLTEFAYSNAEQLLDSVEDFLKGPDFLENLNGEQSLKEHSAKNEKLCPVSLIEGYNPSQDPYEYKKLNIIQKMIYVVTINGHLLPGFFLRNTPAVIAFDWFFVPGKNFMHKKLIAVNKNDNTGCLRTISRKKCFELLKRYCKVMKSYKRNHIKIEKQYREKFSEMTSEKFWRNYLGI